MQVDRELVELHQDAGNHDGPGLEVAGRLANCLGADDAIRAGPDQPSADVLQQRGAGHLDHTNSACARGRRPLQVAECGDPYPHLPCRLQEGCAFGNLGLFSIDNN